MEKDISIKVKEFISKYWNEPFEKIAEETRIEDDLGITGDDASEFITEFGQKFDVDLSGLQIEKHFGPEASFDPKIIIAIAIIAFISGIFGWKYGLIVVIFIACFWCGFFWKNKKTLINHDTLQVEHLITAAKEKKWSFEYKTKI